MSVKKSGNTVEKVFELAKPIADELGLDLWDVRFEKEGSNWYLRVFIDKESGVFVEDCEAISRPLNKLLDETDPIDQSYIFEVCSAGLGRELRKKEHFEKYIGCEVKVRFIRAINNVKELSGIILNFDKEIISLKINEEEIMEIKLADCAYVKLNDDEDLF